MPTPLPAVVPPSHTKRLHLISVPVVVFLVSWGQMTHGKPSVTGDGPHYLMVTQSLLADGDLDVANNYEENEGRLFGADGLKPERFVQATPSGRSLSVHDIGLSILALPAYRLARTVAPHVPESLLSRVRMSPGLFVYSVVCLFMLMMTSAGWWLVARTMADFVSARNAALLALLFALSPPMGANGSAVFPEVPALLVASLAVAKAYGRARLPNWLVLLAVGLLPWFHRKYAAAAIGLVIVLALRSRADSRRATLRYGLQALAVAGVPAALLLAWTYGTWGSLGGPLTLGRVPLSWGTFASGSLGIFFDREFGIVPWAPAALLVPVAWAMAGQRGLLLLLPALLLYIPAAAHDQWWGGWGPVGRFLVPAAPLAAMATTLAAKAKFPRFVSPLLVTCQVAMSAWVWQHPRVLWNFGDGHNRLFELLPYGSVLERSLPSYATDPNAWMVGCSWLVAVTVATVAALRWGRTPEQQGAG
jgi:hypothetical protein